MSASVDFPVDCRKPKWAARPGLFDGNVPHIKLVKKSQIFAPFEDSPCPMQNGFQLLHKGSEWTCLRQRKCSMDSAQLAGHAGTRIVPAQTGIPPRVAVDSCPSDNQLLDPFFRSCPSRRSRNQRPPQTRVAKTTGNRMLNNGAATRTLLATAPPR